MRIDLTIASDGPALRMAPVLRADPTLRAGAAPAPSGEPAPATAPDGNLSLRRLIGDIDIRRLSPRQMAETSLDLYVAGVLPWEEYAMLAFQAELHPDYNRTIGALTGEPAAPDRPRDFLGMWEERLRFEEEHNAGNPHLVARTRRIVQVFRQIASPTDLMA
ncbi:hypothetical protein [Shumkonia mesophila]|uniref:hypothetical protein n=1 Tax=Shumkonia mesophila TaxID=2838854 RepID=UPI0029341C0B|nr:hypothetical protein [Shumkonia mesophila]